MQTSGLRQTCTYAGRTQLGRNRPGFQLLHLSRRLRPRLVGAETDVCIEGFPRSANSLAVHAFRIGNPHAHIAHHVHVPMQVVRAVELGVPCAVLIREPIDAIASLLIMSQGQLPRRMAMRSYESFYKQVARVKEGIVLVRFSDLTSDPFVVARDLNRRFGASFVAPSLDRESRERAMGSIRRENLQGERPRTAFTIPTDEKDELKPQIVNEIRRTPRLARLQNIHDALLAEDSRVA